MSGDETPFIAPGQLPQASKAAMALPRGHVLGRYVVLELLGEGGMGEVYAAEDPELDRKIAIKLVKDPLKGQAQQRLLREAQAMAKLAHENVVSIYDVGVVEHRVFLAMEFVDGSTLTQWLKAKPRSWREAVRVFIDAGRGLEAAHRAGMVHRDFKLDNVLIGTDGRVRVSDFGLARGAEVDLEAEAEPRLKGAPLAEIALGAQNWLATPMTQAQLVLGTPTYMAPEQFEGLPADARSDQFSFCVALYRALYGQAPFAAPGPTLVAAVLKGVVAPPPATSKVPAWVHRVVITGLKRAPAERFTSMQALIDALLADPAAMRRRWLSAGAITLGLLAALGGTWWFAQRNSRKCLGAKAQIAAVWSDERRARISAAFERSRVSYAPDLLRALQSSFTRYADEWAAQRTDACEATWVRGTQSDKVLGLRMACLDDRLRELDAVTADLSNADIDTVKASAKATSALTDLSRCADTEGLERRMPLPKNAEAQNEIAALQGELSRGQALHALGKLSEAKVMYEAVVNEAAVLGYAPLQSAAAVQLVLINGTLGNFRQVKPLIEEALRLSELAGDDVSRFAATLAMARLGVERGAPPEESLLFCKLAETMLPRIKSNDAQRFSLHLVRGNVLFAAQQLSAALPEYTEARQIAEAAGSSFNGRYESLLGSIASLLDAMSRHREAIEVCLLAKDLITARYGSDHPDIGFVSDVLAHSYLRLKQPELALPEAERSLTRATAHFGTASSRFAESLTTHGEVLTALGQLREGERELRQALGVVNNGESSNNYRSDPVSLAINLLKQKRWAEALIELEKSEQLRLQIGTRFSSRVRLNKALALAQLDRVAEAERVLTHALEHPGEDASNELTAEVRITLAKLLWSRPTEQQKALSLMQTALDDLEQSQNDVAELKNDAHSWLASHRVPSRYEPQQR